MSFLLQNCTVSSLTRSCFNYTKQLKNTPTPTSYLAYKRTESTIPPTNKQWNPIYHLPLIRWAASFNRLKVYQTLVTAVAVPAVYALEQVGTLVSGSYAICAAVGVSGVLTLTLCSLGPKNLIGFIYINEQQDRIKLAYLDFWGLRREIETGVDDIVPDWEQARPSRYDFYKNVCLHSDPKTKYKLLHRYGVILERNQFGALIGE